MRRRTAVPLPAEPQRAAPERVTDAAETLFWRLGIRAVNTRMIAAMAETNAETVLKHFGPIENLVVRYLKSCAESEEASWATIEEECPGDPAAQLREWIWLTHQQAVDWPTVGNRLSNAAMELTFTEAHRGRRVVCEYKARERSRLVKLCEEARYREPEGLADKLILLLEGCYATAPTSGDTGPCSRFIQATEDLFTLHAPRRKPSAEGNT